MFGGQNCSAVLPQVYLSFLTASVSFLFFLVTGAGNSLVCLAVYKNPTGQLRTPFNVFVVNLACADLIVGLVADPIVAVMHVKEGLADSSLKKQLRISHMAMFISCTASVLSLAALTVDRNIAVTSPIYYRTKNSLRQALVASFIIWLVSFSLPFVYFKVGFISYFFFFANTVVVLTFVILIASYRCILRKLEKQFQLSVSQLQAGRKAANARRKVAEQEKRVSKAFLLVLSAYIACYCPACVMIYITSFCTSCSCYSIHWLRDAQSLFVLLNSCLNPFLYAWRLPRFRKAFAIILHLPKTSSSARREGLALVRSRRAIIDGRKKDCQFKEYAESRGRASTVQSQLVVLGKSSNENQM